MNQTKKMNEDMYERLKAELDHLLSGQNKADTPLNWEDFCAVLEDHSQFSHKDVDGESGFIDFYFHNTSDGPEFLILKISKDVEEGIITEKSCLEKEDWFNSLYEKVKEMHRFLDMK